MKSDKTEYIKAMSELQKELEKDWQDRSGRQSYCYGALRHKL